MKCFLKKSEPLQKYIFSDMIFLVFTSGLYKVKTKSQRTWLHKRLLGKSYKSMQMHRSENRTEKKDKTQKYEKLDF